jgi:hypothetical protein
LPEFLSPKKLGNIFGQNDCVTEDRNSACCNGIIVTDPEAPVNNEKPPAYKNTFDWRTQKIWVYHPDGGYDDGIGQPIQIDNPFHTNHSYLQHVNIFSQGAEGLDYSPEDGWELLHRNLGHDLSNDNILVDPAAAEDREGPYFILYNKYTGTLRLAASFRTFSLDDKIITTLSFKDTPGLVPTGLFNQYGDLSSTLDKPTAINNISVASQGGQNNNSWFVVDFKMAYDPCGCSNNSELLFEFFTFDQADVDLGGRLIATSVPLDGSGSSPLLNGQDFIAAVNRDDFNVRGGMLTYQNIDDLVNKYDQSSYNLDPLQNLAYSAFGKILELGASAVDDKLNTVINNALTDFIGADVLAEFGEEEKLDIGYGIAGATSKFLMSSLNPKKPKIPNVHFIEGEMLLRGTYSNTTPISIGGINLVAPGSSKSLEPSLEWWKYPLYNEQMGIAAVLEKPKVTGKVRITETPTSTEAGVRTHYYTLKEPLKYALNPASEIDLDKTRIYGAYVVKYVRTDRTGTKHYPDEVVSDFYPISNLDDLYIPIDLPANIGDYYTETYVYLRLMFDNTFQKNNHGKINRSFQIATYDTDHLRTPPATDLSGRINAGDFPDAKRLVDGAVYGTNTTVHALDKLYVKGNIGTSTSLVTASLTASGSVNVRNNAVIGPNVLLEITGVNGFEFDYSIHPQSGDQIKHFCANKYRANTMDPRRKAKNSGVMNGSPTDDTDAKTTSTIFPNPTTGKFYLQTGKDEVVNHLIITNSLGSVVYKRSDIKEAEIMIDLSHQPNGIYFLNVKKNEKTYTEKIVKN